MHLMASYWWCMVSPVPHGVCRIASTKDCGLLSRPEDFGKRLVVVLAGASHCVFRSTLQGFESIDCQPLTVI
jgi:hypothetical protein